MPQSNHDKKDVMGLSYQCEKMKKLSKEELDLEMKKDQEYRLLHEKLREKEYRVRELEAKVLATKSVSEPPRQVITESKLTKKSGKSGKRVAKAGKEKASAKEAVYPDKEIKKGIIQAPWLNRPEKNPIKPTLNENLDNISVRASEKSNKGSSKFIISFEDPRRALIEGTNPEKSFVQVEKERRSLKTKQSENTFQKVIEDIMHNHSALLDYCILGPGNGSPELVRLSGELESFYLDFIENEPVSDTSISMVQRLLVLQQRLLDPFLTILNNRSNAISSLRASEVNPAKIRSNFLLEVHKSDRVIQNVLSIATKWIANRCWEKCISFVDIAIEKIRSSRPNSSIAHVASNAASKPKLTDSSTSKDMELLIAICDLIQLLYSSLGDTKRYKQMYATESSTGNTADFTDSMLLYWKATRISPWSGKGHKSLAVISKLRGDIFEACYYLCRSLAVPQPYMGREALLSLFEKVKSQAEDLTVVNALSALPFDQHLQRFQKHFLTCLAIAYERAGADKFAAHFEKLPRHMAALIQMCAAAGDAVAAGGKGRTGGDFLQFRRNVDTRLGAIGLSTSSEGVQLVAGTGHDSSQPSDPPHARGHSSIPVHNERMVSEVGQVTHKSLVMCFAIVHTIELKFNLEEMLANCLDKIAEISEESFLEREEADRDMFLGRVMTQSMHVLTSVPGLMDSFRLILGLVSSVLGEGGALAVHADVSDTILQQTVCTLHATMATVRMFLSWWEQRRSLHFLAVADRVGWAQMEGRLDRYVENAAMALGSHLRERSRAGVSREAAQLPEVLDMLGFLPLSEDSMALATADAVDESGAGKGSFSIEEYLDNAAKASSSGNDLDISLLVQRFLLVRKHLETLTAMKVQFGTLQDKGLYYLTNTRQAVPCHLLNSVDHEEGDLMRVLNLPLFTAWRTRKTESVSEKAGSRPRSRVSQGLGGGVTVLPNGAAAAFSTSPLSSSFESAPKKGTSGTVPSPFGGQHLPPPPQPSSRSASVGVRVSTSVDDMKMAQLRIDGPPEPPPIPLDMLQDEEGEAAGQESDEGDDDEDDADEGGCEPGEDDGEVASDDDVDRRKDGGGEGHNSTVSIGSSIKGEAARTTNLKGLLRIPASHMREMVGAGAGKDHGDSESGGDVGPRGGGKGSKPMKERRSNNKVSNPRDVHSGRGGTNATNHHHSAVNGRLNGNLAFLRDKSLPSSVALPLIVVDAPNVAMRHGLNEKFSCLGIQLALSFFSVAGHKVISFLPDYYLNYADVNGIRRLGKLDIKRQDVRASRVPDDITLLRQLISQGLVVGTPPQDYDDSYCITYARLKDGYVVTNDLYRDHVQRIENAQVRKETQQWIKSHSISYTFVGDEFLPNPDATFER